MSKIISVIAQKIKLHLHSLSIPSEEKARFFKSGIGEYAEGDKLLGITVPVLRKLAKEYSDIALNDIQFIVESEFNEERLLSMFILVAQYKKAPFDEKEMIYDFYIKNLAYVNNWNIVDSSAHLIIGYHLSDKDRSFLLELAASPVMWYRRIAVVATYYFIRQNDFEWTVRIAEILLNDSHDLIHKAVGWMLREVGGRRQDVLVDFLNKYKNNMPRTMLRYAIEKFPQEERVEFLKKD